MECGGRDMKRAPVESATDSIMKQLRTLVTAIILLAGVRSASCSPCRIRSRCRWTCSFTFAPRSLALWLLVAFALGGLAGLLVSSFYVLRSRAALSSSCRQLAGARSDLEQLRGKESNTVE